MAGVRHGTWTVKSLWSIPKIVVKATMAFFEDSALTHSAALAFFTVLSLAPILVLLLWLTSALGTDLQQRLIDHLAGLVGMEAADLIETVVDSAERDVDIGHVAGWLSLIGLAVSATGVFAQLQIALNAIWGVRAKPIGIATFAWLRKRVLSLGLILSFGFLLLVSLVVSSALAALMFSVRERFPGGGWLWAAMDLVVPFAVYVAIFMTLFRFVPDARLRWRHVALGALVTAALFLVGKWLIGFYLGTSAIGSTYGAASSLALMLVWSYYSAAIVLFGAEITQMFVRASGERIAVEPHATSGQEPHTPRATERPR